MDTGLWCDKCAWVMEKIKKIPNCKQCFPGILEENEDAWQIYGLASKDPWGISPSTVLQLMELFEIDDRHSCLNKVLYIAQELGRLRDESRGNDSRDNGGNEVQGGG